MWTRAQLERAAAEEGFRAESFEKVLRLLDLLAGLNAHPFLAGRWVLKGGTALNLFQLDLPRLSVDVDLNYIGASDRDTMQGERPHFEEAVRAVCERSGLVTRRVPSEHAGGKWRLGYTRAEGGTGTLELDLNFLLRTPLWDPVHRDSPQLLGLSAEGIPVLDPHELAGGKLAALFSRSAPRDVYDTTRLLEDPRLEPHRLRLAFVLYGAMSRRDWREVSLQDVRLSPRDASRTLLPLLRSGLTPGPTELEPWCERLVARCRELLEHVLPLRRHEVEFLTAVNEEGVVHPELLTDETELLARIRRHPALGWKVLNVRRHRSAVQDDSEEA